METKAYLKPVDAARYACLSVASLARMRVEGSGPRYVKLGHRLVAYAKEDIDTWLDQRKRRCTAEPASPTHTDGDRNE